LFLLQTLLLSSSASNPLADGDSQCLDWIDLKRKIKILEAKLDAMEGDSLHSHNTAIQEASSAVLTFIDMPPLLQFLVRSSPLFHICIALIVASGIVAISIAFDKGK